MDYVIAAAAVVAGTALMVLVKWLRPLGALLFAVAGYALRDSMVGDWVRAGVGLVGGWVGPHVPQLVPYLGVALAVIVGVAIAGAVYRWDAGAGTAVLALVFPTLLVLSGSSPVADGILAGLGWASDQVAQIVVTKGVLK